MHYIFVDYENVQPQNLKPLLDISCKIFVFVGALQPKLPVKLVTEMQKLGDRAQYIQISSTAKDALDFHIAYYIGQIAAADPSGYFHILSNDKGYDPLIEHLRAKDIKIERAGIPARREAKLPVEKPVKMTQTKTVSRPGTTEKIDKIKQSLKNSSKPGTEEKLHNFIKNKLPDTKDIEVQNLINHLRNKKIISGLKDKLQYHKIAS